MTSAGEADTFDKTWSGIHRKASELADIVGGSFFAAHVKADGNSELSGSPSVDRVACAVSGTAALKQHFGLGKLADIDWLEHKRKALQAGASQRSAAWRERGATLKRLVDKSLGQADRPFLLVLLWGSQQLVCASSHHGQQLLASEWWQGPVMEALRSPHALWGVPALPRLVLPVTARHKRPRITNGTAAAAKPALGGAAAAGSSNQALPAAPAAAHRDSHGLADAAAAARSGPREHVARSLPSVPQQASGSHAPRQQPREDVTAALAAMRPAEGSVAWYSQCLASDPGYMRPVQLEKGMFALPGYDSGRQKITGTPVQVTVGVREGDTTCTCPSYTTMSSLEGGAPCCLHTEYVRQHLHVLQRLWAYQPGETVPIRTRVQEQSGSSEASYYWVDGTFVRCHQGRLKCSNTAHGRSCAHTQAVANRFEIEGLGGRA